MSAPRVLLACLLVTLFLSGCGSDDGGEKPSNPVPAAISGFVVKGPVAGAKVEIRTIGAAGMPGTLVLGPLTTQADGSWSGTLEDGQDKEYLVVAGGGTYVDEATGSAVTLAPAQQLVGYLNTRNSTVAVVTPVTHAMHVGAQTLIARGVSPADAWANRRSEFEGFGFNPLTTAPQGTGSGGQRSYAALLAGFSALAHESEFTDLGTNAFDVVAALARDLSDGRFDAKDPGGSEIRVGSEPLPAADPGGVGALVEAAEAHAGDAGLWGVVEISPPVPPTGCSAVLQAAHDKLEETLFFEINDEDPETPDDVDFREAKERYEQVIQCDPDNVEAHLALSLIEVAILTTDPEVNAAFDDWKAYLDESVPFETGAPTLGGFGPFGVPRGDAAFSLPVDVIQRTVLSLARMGRFDSVPQVSTVQEILAEKVIPAATRAIGHLDIVLGGDPAYEFTITPKMQGDMLELPLQADRTDFLATRGALHGLRAACRAAVSYEVSMPAYDESNILAALDQENGTWLKLRAGGTENMAAVPADLLAAARDLDAGITALFAEIDSGTDNQDDEVIKIGPDLPARSEIADFQSDELPRITRSLQGPTPESYDWDFDEETPRVTLTVDLEAFFTNPVPDFKALAPRYELSTEVVPYEEDHFWSDGTQPVTVDVPESGPVYGGTCWKAYYDFELSEDSCYGAPSWLETAMRQVLESRLEEARATTGWAGDVSVQVSYPGGQLSPGPQIINLTFTVSYSTAERWVAIPVITFEADTFEEWAADWPDPTVHGLFPGVPSADQMLRIFGIDAYDWEKVLRLDWADEFGDASTSPPLPPRP